MIYKLQNVRTWSFAFRPYLRRVRLRLDSSLSFYFHDLSRSLQRSILCSSQPWTMMASLENKVDEQVSKVPQQNGGNCRNEELQLEDVRDNNNEVRHCRTDLNVSVSRFGSRTDRANETTGMGSFGTSDVTAVNRRIRWCLDDHSPDVDHMRPIVHISFKRCIFSD